MKDVRVDGDGNMRCWNCGGKEQFISKRTVRAKVIGVGAGVATLGLAAAATPLVTKKKLKCQLCGEYNQTGNAKPYTKAASSKWRKRNGEA